MLRPGFFALFLGALAAFVGSAPATATAERILANDNRTAAGTLSHGTLHLSLDARVALWYPDGERGAGIPIQTFAESGKPAQIPAPLIRVPAGTLIVATVRNSIPHTVLTMHGMVSRPATRDVAVGIPYGEQRVLRFRAGVSGTFLYWGGTSANKIGRRFGPDSQLSGAIVVDPPGQAVASNDRVFVVTQWINVTDKQGRPNFNYELDTINGRAWPHTERLSYPRGATVHWHVINASFGKHPLHMHGFYFTVDSRGNGIADNLYPDPAQRDREVTELMTPGSTFALTLHAARTGNWLFHCHLTYHTVGHLPVAQMVGGGPPIADDAYENHFVRSAGMGGLILGFTVRDAARHALARNPQPKQRVQLRVEAAADNRADAPSFRYATTNGPHTIVSPGSVGPTIVLTRGVPASIAVTNALNEATAVHWHGIELQNSFYDGVSGFSGSGEHLAPMIMPGETFDVRMTPPRSGTFIYHTHMDDVYQLRGGLAGPLIVVEPGTTFDPASDHVFTLTTTHSLPDVEKIFVNGQFAPPAITMRAGVKQRLRFINVTTFWTNAVVSLSAAKRTAQWSALQVDGANVAASKAQPGAAVTTVTIGQTRDFTFTPAAPGDMQLQFWPDRTSPNVVTVAVHVVP